MVQPELVDEQHQAECEEREAEAGPGPDEGVGRRRVADLGLVGPVLGPRPAHIRTARDGGQRRVDQEVAGPQHRVRCQAVGRGPAGCRGRSSPVPWRYSSRSVPMAPARASGTLTVVLRQIDPLQLFAHRGRGPRPADRAAVRRTACRTAPGRCAPRSGWRGGSASRRCSPARNRSPCRRGCRSPSGRLSGSRPCRRRCRRPVIRTAPPARDEAFGLRRRALIGEHRRPGEQREAERPPRPARIHLRTLLTGSLVPMTGRSECWLTMFLPFGAADILLSGAGVGRVTVRVIAGSGTVARTAQDRSACRATTRDRCYLRG